MKHRVTGIDREGRGVEFELDAPTPALAERAALGRGCILIERVTAAGPISAIDSLAEQSQRRPVLIELTAKRWKLGILVSAVLVLAGAIVCVAGLAMSLVTMRLTGAPAIVAVIGASLVAVGCVLLVIYQFLAWWHHG